MVRRIIVSDDVYNKLKMLSVYFRTDYSGVIEILISEYCRCNSIIDEVVGG